MRSNPLPIEPSTQQATGLASEGDRWRSRSNRETPSRPDRKSRIAASLIMLCTSLSGACGSKTGLTAPCVVEIEHVAPEVFIVLDHSASVLSPSGGPDGQTFWDVTVRSLESAISPLGDDIAFGAAYFPVGPSNPPAPNCAVASTVELPASTGQSRRIIELFRTIRGSGNTPTADAIASVSRYLAAHPTSVQRFIVLGTDGMSDCNLEIPCETCVAYNGEPAEHVCMPGNSWGCLDTSRVVMEVHALARNGVPTLVIGLPNTNTVDILVECERGVGRDGHRRWARKSGRSASLLLTHFVWRSAGPVSIGAHAIDDVSIHDPRECVWIRADRGWHPRWNSNRPGKNRRVVLDRGGPND